METHKQVVRNTHSLHSIDPTSRTGVCDRCGLTKIAKVGRFKDTQYWGCAYAHTKLDANGNPKVNTFEGEVKNAATARNGHTLTSFLIEDQSGVCDRCGPTTIVKCGKNPGTQYWGCAFAYPRKSNAVDLHRHCLTNINKETRDATCSQCGPTQVIKNGGGWICRGSIKAPAGAMNLDSYRKHKLSEINEEKRRAVCAHCGPVDINSGGTQGGKKRWRCQFAQKPVPLSKDRPKKHFLSQIDETNRTAICSKCGPISIVKRDSYKGTPQWRCLSSFRWQRLADRYGMKEQDYINLHQKQGGLCAICKKDDPLCVDHEHQPGELKRGRVYGKIRGLLCRHCNTMLGHAYDNISTLEEAIHYLHSHSVIDTSVPTT